MQAIKCELCGSNQLIKKDGYFQCEHCGTKYTLEEAKKLIVSGTVEFVIGNAEKERLLKNAETLLNLGETNKALNLYHEITHKYPNDYRGWFGLFTTPIYRGLASSNSFKLDDHINLLKHLTRSIELCEDKSKITDFFDFVIESYGANLKTKYLLKKDDLKVYNSNGQNIDIPTIDNITQWLIYHTNKVRILINYEPFNIFINNLTSTYINSVRSGNIIPSSSSIRSLSFSTPNKNFIEWNNKLNIQFLTPLLKQIQCNNVFSTMNMKTDSFNIICERWIYSNRVLIKSPIILTKEFVYKTSNLCQHCGGEFELKSLFKKVCSKCGKPKDY